MACGAPSGEGDDMICVLKFVSNLVKENKLGRTVKSLTEDSREKLAEAFATFTSVDNTRASVSMGELRQYKEVKEVVSPQLSEEAMVIEGEEVPTLRQGERSAHIVFGSNHFVPRSLRIFLLLPLHSNRINCCLSPSCV